MTAESEVTIAPTAADISVQSADESSASLEPADATQALESESTPALAAKIDEANPAAASSPESSPESLPKSSSETPSEALPEALPVVGDHREQVRLKADGNKMLLILPAETVAGDAVAASWNEIWQQFKQRLDAGQRSWSADTPVHLLAKDRLLDGRQLQAIADALVAVQLRLRLVETTRRQTAVAAATAGYSVEQQTTLTPLLQTTSGEEVTVVEPLYLETTLRSGVEIRHGGSVVIVGDVNPGSAIISEGDILVWGRLRGVAHAGAKGNLNSRVMALQMQPTQIRIADFVARVSAPPAEYYPEVAYVSAGVIRIQRAGDFPKTAPQAKKR